MLCKQIFLELKAEINAALAEMRPGTIENVPKNRVA